MLDFVRFLEMDRQFSSEKGEVTANPYCGNFDYPPQHYMLPLVR